MGQASREKRERRNPRAWTTTNPWTGRPETFMVEISAKGLREWERDRASLHGRGYRDRPPHIDRARIRSWAESGPNPDPMMPTGQIVLGGDPTAHMIGSWGVSDGRLVASLNLGRRMDGTLRAMVGVGMAERPARCSMSISSVEAAEQLAHDIARSTGLPPLFYTSADQMLADLG
jgi:hypothetical protein